MASMATREREEACAVGVRAFSGVDTRKIWRERHWYGSSAFEREARDGMMGAGVNMHA